MLEHAKNLEFEEADRFQKKIEYLQQYQSRSAVVNTRIGTVDVFNLYEDGNFAYVNYLAVANGSIVQTKSLLFEKKLDEPAAEMLAFAVATMRHTFNSEAKEIIVPMPIEFPEADIIITIPKTGDKKKLLELSEKNVVHFREELRHKKMLNLEEKTEAEKIKILHQLQKDLQLPVLPMHIECFDNSNLQGSYPVSAMVCFKQGQPSKSDYRRFNVKTVTGINDFATMKEVVYRRYKRLVEENSPLPQLVIIDGGKGQLSAAMQSIHELHLTGKTTVVGLAKNEEEIFFPGDTQSIKLPWDSESLKLVRLIRDEVHRIGITHHRNLRSKGTFTNELEQVIGIGKASTALLLKAFKSITNIRKQDQGALENIVGKKKAGILVDYFTANPTAPAGKK